MGRITDELHAIAGDSTNAPRDRKIAKATADAIDRLNVGVGALVRDLQAKVDAAAKPAAKSKAKAGK